MFEWIASPEIWASLVTLTLLEIVLGIDNVIFISIVAGKLNRKESAKARVIGLAIALIMRILLLASLVWIVGLKAAIFTFNGFELSWRDVILIAGGLFLLVKGTHEIHNEMETDQEERLSAGSAKFGMVIVQITLLDLVFSLDSVITAIGMTHNLPVMVAAVVIAMGVMLLASGPTARFIQEHPTTKMLALSFLLLIGMALIADGLHFHIPRGYVYFAIAFSLAVEVLNLLAAGARRKTKDAPETPPQ